MNLRAKRWVGVFWSCVLTALGGYIVGYVGGQAVALAVGFRGALAMVTALAILGAIGALLGLEARRMRCIEADRTIELLTDNLVECRCELAKRDSMVRMDRCRVEAETTQPRSDCRSPLVHKSRRDTPG